MDQKLAHANKMIELPISYNYQNIFQWKVQHTRLYLRFKFQNVPTKFIRSDYTITVSECHNQVHQTILYTLKVSNLINSLIDPIIIKQQQTHQT